MHPRAFSFVSEEDPSLLFAVGLEVIGDDGVVDTTVTFRPLNDGLYSFSVHESVDSARALFSRITPVVLERSHHHDESIVEYQLGRGGDDA